AGPITTTTSTWLIRPIAWSRSARRCAGSGSSPPPGRRARPRLRRYGSRMLRMLPLGDSITYGDGGSNAGYRGRLAELLAALDEPFRFVGTCNANRGRLPLEQSFHEGHCGWVIRGAGTGREGLHEHLPRWL